MIDGTRYQELQNDLGKYQRNITQMNEEQKKKYARALWQLKKKIVDTAAEIGTDYLVRDLLVQDTDSAEEISKVIGQIMEKDAGRSASYATKQLFSTFDIWQYLDALEKLKLQITYEAYGPYWLSRCVPTGDEDYPFRNDLIGKCWNAKCAVWESDDGLSITKMLPPTRELLTKEYQEKWKAAQENEMQGIT